MSSSAPPYQCGDNVGDLVLTGALSLGFFSCVFLASRLGSPRLFPSTYKRLALKPGQCSYWDDSVASAVNGLVAPVLAAVALYREPALLGTDAFVCTPDTCRTVIYFMSWIFFDLCVMLYNYGHWSHTSEMMIHHTSAIVAWLLYLQGGYGHAMNLVGLACEATGPTMNLRYFLSELQLKHTTAYLVNGMAFLVVWLLVRILFAIPAGAYLIMQQHATLSTLPTWRYVCFVSFFLVGASLNCFWMSKLVTGALKVLRQSKRS